MPNTQDQVVHEPENNRFVVHFHDGHGDNNSGELVYRRDGDVLHLVHSQVPANRQGQGLGGRLMAAALANIEAANLKVQPVCRYTQHYINRNKRWHSLLA